MTESFWTELFFYKVFYNYSVKNHSVIIFIDLNKESYYYEEKWFDVVGFIRVWLG
jgi:hypothetical protein